MLFRQNNANKEVSLMTKCNKVTPKVSKAAKTLATSKSKSKKSEAAKVLKGHQDKNH